MIPCPDRRCYIALAAAVVALTLLSARPIAQGSTAKDPATDADVLGSQRLFTAWSSA